MRLIGPHNRCRELSNVVIQVDLVSGSFLTGIRTHRWCLYLPIYLNLYRQFLIDKPQSGQWTTEENCFAIQANLSRGFDFYQQESAEEQIQLVRQAFYALCTHIDHQLRVLIGTLREESLLDNTVICFTSDHGDMLGNHGMWAKRLFYEYSANIPMILVGTGGDDRVGVHQVDHRLVGWTDIMPTLLDLAGISIPSTVEGLSMVGKEKRASFYGEVGEDAFATRMVHDGRYKLIYYPVGNQRQLFDLNKDPNEGFDLSNDPTHRYQLEHLTKILVSQLYGTDLDWVIDGKLVGLIDQKFLPRPDKGLSSQRGDHFPPPPQTNMKQI